MVDREVSNTRRSFGWHDHLPNDRKRLLRSLLRRQKVLERLEMEKKRNKEERQPEKNGTALPQTVSSSYYLPPIYQNLGATYTTPRNIKGELIDMMMLQNSQMHQLLTHRMAMSLITPQEPQSTRHRDELILSLVYETIKAKSNNGLHRDPVPVPTYYIPLLPRLPNFKSSTKRDKRERGLEVTPSPPASMTSRWKQRLPVKHDQITHASVTSRNQQHRRKALRRFRIAAYAAVYTSIMRNRQAKRLMYTLRKPTITDDVITGIRIKECVLLLQKIYLDPERKMFRLLKQMYDANIDLSAILTNKSTKEQRHKTMETLAAFIENITYEMTFAPMSTGSLGTGKRSNLSHLLQPQQSFPEHYFWNMEKEILSLDAYNRTPENMGASEEFIILIGLCLGRGLISTILRYPYQFGLTESGKTEALSTKVRLIITLFVYLIRKLYAPPNGNPVAAVLPDDLSRKLFSDEAMATIFKKLRSSFDYAEKLLRDWGQNYLKLMRHN